MEREGRRDEGVSYYLWIPFKFIHQTLRSLLLKLFGMRTPPNHTFQEEEEEVEVVEVSSRGLPAKPKKLQKKSRANSGKPGGINKNRMQKERDNKRHRCKLITQTVMAFLECLNLRHSSSSSDKEKEEEASSVETSARSLKVASKRKRKPLVSSGKRGGVNNYDM